MCTGTREGGRLPTQRALREDARSTWGSSSSEATRFSASAGPFPGIAGKGQSRGVEPFHSDLSRWASGGPGPSSNQKPSTRGSSKVPGSPGTDPWGRRSCCAVTRQHCQKDSKGHCGAGALTPGWREPRPLPLPSTPRGQWLWPLFSGRQRSAQPPSLVSGHLPARNIQASEMPWGQRKPMRPGRPSLVLTVAMAPGTGPTVGSVRKRPQAGHWNLAMLQGRSC